MGEHYGPKVAAYWFDAGYGLVRRGFVPWDRMTKAAKSGHSERLICYNSGIENYDMYTPLQDYWAGEVCRLGFSPNGQFTPSGLPWYSFTTWHANKKNPDWGEWGMSSESRGLNWPAPPASSVAEYLRRFGNCGGAVTFNLLCYQDGSVHDTDLLVMKDLKKLIRGR